MSGVCRIRGEMVNSVCVRLVIGRMLVGHACRQKRRVGSLVSMTSTVWSLQIE